MNKIEIKVQDILIQEKRDFILDSNYELVSIVGDTVNLIIGPDLNISNNFSSVDGKDTLGTQKELYGESTTLGDLEAFLISNFGENIEYTNQNGRFANVFAWQGTHIHRGTPNIVLNGTYVANNIAFQNNMGENVVDPLGWSSRSIAPNIPYGLLGKIQELRRNSDKYNADLHEQVLKTRVQVSDLLGYAVELKLNDSLNGISELAIMPVNALLGGEDIIKPFSQDFREGSIQTAKHYLLNNDPYSILKKSS